ncbi:hypothetical protein [Myxococcus landrumensis]|uniref:B box-type domain-containing protein n=1 Tax=Myxococcus landrumensis TaxID=2813577 RepID=A0ABX7NE45_9BACT|nr:hypothetical protein [Myxococcus landrumus]QSQ16644.1 hypothetical protein JY572_11600 [Myxococcus landrumus]
MPSPTAIICQTHRSALAGWRCLVCQAALCPECAVGERIQTVELVRCGLCGGDAEVLRIHRGVVPLAHRLKSAWRYPFSLPAVQLVLALGTFLAVMGWVATMVPFFIRLPVLFFYAGTFWATFFGLVRESARGDTSLDIPEFTELGRDVLVPGLRGVLVFLVASLPALAFALLAYPGVGAATDVFSWVILWRIPPALVRDGMFWLLLVLGALWLPTGLLLAASHQPARQLLNLRLALRMVRGLGSDYGVAIAALAGLVPVHLAAHVLAAGLRTVNFPFIPHVLAECITLVVPLLAAHILGLLLYVRGDQVGYGEPREYLEPLLGGTRPVRDAPPLVEHMAMDARAQDAVTQAVDKEAVFDGALDNLTTAVDARNIPLALATYAELEQFPAARVPAALHLFIGQAAAVEENFPLAVAALERAADVAPDQETAPRALVLLARVLGERMNDTARAEEVYRYVQHRYPDTAAARFASKHAHYEPE